MKFIRKAKILADCWIDDPVLGSIPLEIALLAQLKHPNIVKVKSIFRFSLQNNCMDYLERIEKMIDHGVLLFCCCHQKFPELHVAWQ